MSTDNSPTARRLRNLADTAEYAQVHPATVESWHGKGYISAYKLNNSGPILFDLDELERAFKTYGPQKMRDGRRRGAKGRVVPLAVVVTEGADQ